MVTFLCIRVIKQYRYTLKFLMEYYDQRSVVKMRYQHLICMRNIPKFFEVYVSLIPSNPTSFAALFKMYHACCLVIDFVPFETLTMVHYVSKFYVLSCSLRSRAVSLHLQRTIYVSLLFIVK